MKTDKVKEFHVIGEPPCPTRNLMKITFRGGDEGEKHLYLTANEMRVLARELTQRIVMVE